MTEQQPEGFETSPGRRPGGRLAGMVVILIAAATFGTVAVGQFVPSDVERALAEFVPSASRPDPSIAISGVAIDVPTTNDTMPDPDDIVYAVHPPSGGAHGSAWVGCDGAVYAEAVQDAAAVHSLAHGAVWITYDPVRITPTALRALSMRVLNDSYVMLSPYPGLDAPVSMQAWGHRLALDTPEDPRFEQFMVSLRANPFLPPEPNGDCRAT